MKKRHKKKMAKKINNELKKIEANLYPVVLPKYGIILDNPFVDERWQDVLK